MVGDKMKVKLGERREILVIKFPLLLAIFKL